MKITLIMPLDAAPEKDVFMIGDVNILAGVPKSRIQLQESLPTPKLRLNPLDSGFIFLDIGGPK